MLSAGIPSRRRRETELSNDDDEANDDYGSEASSSKRLRTNGDGSSPPTSSPEPPRTSNALKAASIRRNHNSSGDNGHQPGAIVRVALTNFVTYENAVFFPGPNLNMVIGPNGTGKSSLVCAICLGLGYAPKHLGRAGQVGEFVKHGKDSAIIEVELKGRPDEIRNHVVRVRIIKDGDKRKWWLNESETSLKSIQALMKSFGIQVDNLCQFLPQDRVAEFAGLSPVELLHETQRAAAPEEMLAWHDELKTLRAEEKALQLQESTDKETMSNLEERQENLRGDVERLQERTSIEEKIDLLEKTIPFVEYRTARETYLDENKKKKAAAARLRALELEVAPVLEAVNRKQEYYRQIDVVVKERKRTVHDCERVADQALQSLEALSDEIKKVEQTRKAENDGDKTRKQDIQNIMGKIRTLKAQMQNAPPTFDAGEWNTQIVRRQVCTIHTY